MAASLYVPMVSILTRSQRRQLVCATSGMACVVLHILQGTTFDGWHVPVLFLGETSTLSILWDVRPINLFLNRDGEDRIADTRLQALNRRPTKHQRINNRSQNARSALGSSLLLASQSPFSGVWEALTTILVSEIGDKTFFLTMILAIRKGRWLAMLSSQTALWLMTVFSASIGILLRSLPQRVADEVSIRIAAAALMIIFGIQSFRERESSAISEECKGAQDEAECEVDLQLTRSQTRSSTFVWLRFAVLIFLAEWGDRSMLATVTLAATRSPIGVVLGGCLGHFLAASLAVVSSGILQKYVSDRTIKLIGSLLFIGFGVTTLLGIY